LLDINPVNYLTGDPARFEAKLCGHLRRGLSLMGRNPLLAGLRPTHPGEVLSEDVLPSLRLPKTEIARRLGISRALLYSILDEKAPVSPAMALRLGKLFGSAPEIWVNLQRDYDLRTLEEQMAGELAAIEAVAWSGMSDPAE
jgi:antitoxin HigA-1